MHGLMFVAWEQFLHERYGIEMLTHYRQALGVTATDVYLANRSYDDAIFFQGLETVAQQTGKSCNRLLKQYGHYFMHSSLINHCYAYIFARANNARDLLLLMRTNHSQLSQTVPEPGQSIFVYEAISDNPNQLLINYDDNRYQLCAFLIGAIGGTAELFGEKVQIAEHTCMEQGASACRIEVRFTAPHKQIASREIYEQRRIQAQLANLVLQNMPYDQDGITLYELQNKLRKQAIQDRIVRPHILLSTVEHLQYAGFVASNTEQGGDGFTQRRYWRTRSQMMHSL